MQEGSGASTLRSIADKNMPGHGSTAVNSLCGHSPSCIMIADFRPLMTCTREQDNDKKHTKAKPKGRKGPFFDPRRRIRFGRLRSFR